MNALAVRFAAFAWFVVSCVTVYAADPHVAIDSRPIDAQAIVGLDHIPTVVSDLERAQDTYRRLGFALKPGRAHANGLRNAHVKFEDGSGIELIAPPHEASDDLTRDYLEHLKHGEGPAYLSPHARDKAALIAALNAAGIAFEDDDLLTLSDPRLHFLFFVRDNRSPTDRPEHFAHPNSASAMTGVWLALDAPTSAAFQRLLLALGAEHTRASVRSPGTARGNAVMADLFRVNNGRIVVVPKRAEANETRTIVGAEFRVRSLAESKRALRASNLRFARAERPHAIRVAPDVTHGILLEFYAED